MIDYIFLSGEILGSRKRGEQAQCNMDPGVVNVRKWTTILGNMERRGFGRI